MNSLTNRYRRGVGIVLFNNEHKIFIGKRYNQKAGNSFNALNEAWQMPQGGIDENESPQQAAFREMKEEVGTNKGKIIAVSKNWISYDFPSSIQNNIWDGSFIGQTQKWFLIKFLGCDQDINLNQHIQEFSEWKWANTDYVINHIVDFKKNLYQKVFDEFKMLLSSHKTG